MISIIVAMDQNGLIGNKNGLPWRLSADLQYFKKVTLNKPILMGRNTWDSLPGILPNRQHVVISRTPKSIEGHILHAHPCAPNVPTSCRQGVDVVGSISEALELVKDADEIMIIGGASIIEQSLSLADKMYVTEIHQSFKGDCWFPKYDQSLWQETSRESHKADDKNQYDYDFVIYKKKL